MQNELFHYIPSRHGKSVIDTVWQLGQSIKRQQVLEVAYSRLGKDSPIHRQVEPVGLMFSDFYFYLVAFLLDEEGNRRFPDADTPTIYRVDRIEALKETGRRFQMPYKDRFQEGEFRKRVQFMTGGPLQKVCGLSIKGRISIMSSIVCLQRRSYERMWTDGLSRRNATGMGLRFG